MEEFLTQYHLYGIGIGLATFLIIGLFHPLVIKGEYYLGKHVTRYIFAGMGIATLAGSLMTDSLFWSVILGVTAFSSFWGIGEVNEQEERVRRGWFPANPKRKKN